MHHSHLDPSPGQGWRTLPDGRGPHRRGFNRADYCQADYPRSRTRIRVPERGGAAADGKARARQERVPDSLSLPASGRMGHIGRGASPEVQVVMKQGAGAEGTVYSLWIRIPVMIRAIVSGLLVGIVVTG